MTLFFGGLIAGLIAGFLLGLFIAGCRVGGQKHDDIMAAHYRAEKIAELNTVILILEDDKRKLNRVIAGLKAQLFEKTK